MAGAPINIVYPIDGATYPITDPPPGSLASAYVTLSFGVTQGGGPSTVTWGVNRSTLGSARCYDQLTAQQVWKLRGGMHRFWVKTTAGGVTQQDSVKFKVGS